MGTRHGDGQPFQRRSDGRWIARYRDREGRVRSVTGTDRQQVAERREALRASLEPLPTTGTLRDYLESWFATVAPGRYRSQRTLHSNRNQARIHLLPMLGDMALGDIRPSDVQRALDAMSAQRYAPQSVINVAHILSVVLRTAEGDGLIAKNPVRLVRLPRRERPVLPSMTTEQMADFLDQTRGDELWPAWALAFATGMRLGELCGLRWSDWDRGAQTLTIDGQWERRYRRSKPVRVKGKTANARRTLHLPSLGTEALLAQLGQATSTVNVFAYPNGDPWNSTGLSHRWARTLERLGLPHVRFHSIRHSAAVTMLDASGGDIVAVSKVLGHGAISVTVDLYGQESENARKRARDYMDAAMKNVKRSR